MTSRVYIIKFKNDLIFFTYVRDTFNLYSECGNRVDIHIDVYIIRSLEQQ